MSKITICTINQTAALTHTLFKTITEIESVVSVESKSDWGLEINPKKENFGCLQKRDFSFVPVKSFQFNFEDFKKSSSGSSIAAPDAFFSFLQDTYTDLSFELISENESSISIVANQTRAAEEEKDAEALLKEVIEFLGPELEFNYCKYFVNNCLIIDGGESFEGDKAKENEFREKLNQFISEKIEPKPEEKTDFENYAESFEFRPFFGDGLEKLPVYDKGSDHWNWDELYINPGMDSEVFKSGE